MADSIDYGQFITPRPPQVSGSSMLFDALSSIAKAKALRAQQQRDDDLARWKEGQDAQARAAALAETVRAHQAGETHDQGVLGETNRHNVASEGNTAQANTDKMATARATLLSKPELVTALQSDDPRSLDALAPALSQLGFTVDQARAVLAQPPPADAPPAQAGDQPADASPAVAPPNPDGSPAESPVEPPPFQPPPPVSDQDMADAGDAIDSYQPPAPPSPDARTLRGPGGLSFGFDPAANALARARAGSKAAAGITDVASGTKDPFVANSTRDTAPLVKLYMSQGMSPLDAMKMATAAATARAGQASGRRNADVAGAQRRSTHDDWADARAVGAVERAMTDADRMVDWKGLVTIDNALRNTIANATAPNALSHKDAQIQLAKVMRGTTPTEGEMHLLYNNLGGTMDKWNQWVAQLESGDLSPAQMSELRQATRNASAETNQRKTRVMKALRAKFASPTYQMVTPQINAELRARAAAVGVDLPENFLFDETPADGGAVLLGSRKKKGGAAPAAGSDPDAAVQKLLDKYGGQ